MARWEAQRGNLHDNANRLLKRIAETLASAQAIRLALEKLPPAFATTRDDIRTQLDALLVPRFVSMTPVEWLVEFPRYLQAIRLRLEKRVLREDDFIRELRSLRTDYEGLRARIEAQGRQSAELELLRWMIEEYRVSLFAQQLKTRVPVSAQRLAKLREQIR